MAKGTITLSGSTVGTKMESLEVEQGATGGVAGLFKVDNNDTDKVAMSIEAANIDADVLDITMDAVTTARGIDISADALTTGSALYIDSDANNTSTRNIVNIIQNHANASGSTVLRLQQDGTGDIVNFFDGGTEVFTILDGGKVGIGTSVPVTDLTIDGTITLKEQAEADGNTAAYGQLWVNTATPCELYFTTDADNDIALTSGTAIVSGFDADAAQTFNDSGSDVDFRVETNNEANMFFVDGGTDKVGIGTNAVAAGQGTLTVYGRMQVTRGSAFQTLTTSAWAME